MPHNKSKEILTLAVEIGDTLLRSGGEIYRVEDTILHIAAFAVIFCAPKTQLIFSALTGGISWITYLIL